MIAVREVPVLSSEIGVKWGMGDSRTKKWPAAPAENDGPVNKK